MAGGSAVKFYEISALVLSIAQMAFYLIALRKYIKKLKQLAEKLEELGDETRDIYYEFRDADADFYNWYRKFFANAYKYCDSSVKRAKGAVFRGFGESMRKIRRGNDGYRPLAMVGYAGRAAASVVPAVAHVRAVTHNNESARVNTDLLSRWKVVVGIPVEREGDAQYFPGIADSYMRSTHAFGHGFNSAGTSFGVALHNFLKG